MNDEQYNELNEALDNLNTNTDNTNSAINELQEYLEEKDKQEQEEKTQEEQTQAEQTQAEQETSQAQQDVYVGALMDIRNEIQLNNQMVAGQYMMMGIIAGIILFKVLWDKLQ